MSIIAGPKIDLKPPGGILFAGRSQSNSSTKINILFIDYMVYFWEGNYEAASINAICAKSQMSKGLLYHNFTSKDDLYLQCVKLCYNQMTEYLNCSEEEL